MSIRPVLSALVMAFVIVVPAQRASADDPIAGRTGYTRSCNGSSVDRAAAAAYYADHPGALGPDAVAIGSGLASRPSYYSDDPNRLVEDLGGPPPTTAPPVPSDPAGYVVGQATNVLPAAPSAINLTVADNSDHTFYFSSVTSDIETAQRYANAQDIEPTDIHVLYPGYVNANTDVVVYDSYYTRECGKDWAGGHIGGTTFCVSANSTYECQKHEIRYNLNELDGRSPAIKQNLTCHETGHSLGLYHSRSGCLRATADGQQIHLSDADVAKVNEWYDWPRAGGGGSNEFLHTISSLDDRYRLVMQGDGNLVLYHYGRYGELTDPIWASATENHYGASAVMQSDGNLVIYDNGSDIWSSGTAGHPGAWVQIQCDRNVVIYDTNSASLWATNTATSC